MVLLGFCVPVAVLICVLVNKFEDFLYLVMLSYGRLLNVQ